MKLKKFLKEAAKHDTPKNRRKAVAKLEQRIVDLAEEMGVFPETFKQEFKKKIANGGQETWEDCLLLMDIKLLERIKKINEC